ncbi:hypothetical protein Tco_1445367 [Tanacetum coccineum]
MGDENPIRTLGDYSKPSHEGYRNIELPEGNNVVPLRSDTIRTAKLYNDIIMFLQQQGESISEAWTRFKDLLQKVSHHGIDLCSKPKYFMTMSIPPQDEPSINRPVKDPRDFAKPVKAISLPQVVLSTSDRRLVELENQVQCLWKLILLLNARLSKFEADFKQQQSEMTNKINTVLKDGNGYLRKGRKIKQGMEKPRKAKVKSKP